MPFTDLLERCKPTFGPGAFGFGLLAGAAAYGLAILLVPEHAAAEYFLPPAIAAFAALAGAALVERGAPIGVVPTTLPALAVAVGFWIAITLLVIFLPGSWSPPDLGSFAEKMPLPFFPREHELADGREVFGSYLIMGGIAAVAGFAFGGGGFLFVMLLQVLAWAVLLGEKMRPEGFPGAFVPMLKAMGATAPTTLPALVGLALLGAAARLSIRRVLGGAQSEDRSLRAPGLAALVGLLALLLAGSIELFGGGALAKLLGG